MSPRPIHTGIHQWLLVDQTGIRWCEVCGLSEPACEGKQCSGIRNILGRPTTGGSLVAYSDGIEGALYDLPDREDARLSAGSVACATTEDAPTGSPPAAPWSDKKKRRGISPASPAQREHIKAKACIVTGDDRLVQPAHLIPRSLLTVGQGDPRAVVPLRPDIHRLYDSTAGYDLLGHLEPHYRTELAYAVERFGLLPTLRQVTGQRWMPVECAT